MSNPLNPPNSPPETTPELYLYEIAALRATIALMKEEKRRLERKLGFGSRKIALMQAALSQCRVVIEDYQSKPNLEGCPSREKKPSASFRRAPSKKSGRSALAIWGLPKRSDVPRYIARADLETMILQTAATRVGGILGVVVEAEPIVDCGDGTNWRVTGIISGKADRSAALEAVMRAAEQYVKWVVVDDESSLKGRAIGDTIQPAPAFGRLFTQPPNS